MFGGLININIYGKYMASELPSVVLLFWLNWSIYSHSSEENWSLKRFANENLSVKAIIFQKVLSCVPLFHKDFKKHLLIKVSIKKSEYIFRQLI